MTRVGFLIARQAGEWLGGVSYTRNLLAAVRAAGGSIVPVILVAPGDGAAVAAKLGAGEWIETALADHASLAFKTGRVLKRLIGRDLLLERVLRRHRIALLSHSGTIGRGSAIPALTWIPDFQHRRMPQFFAPTQNAARDAAFARVIADSACVVLSSVDAQRDLADFAPGAERNSRVLQFVADVRAPTGAVDPSRIPDEPFFLLPNQFWKHKNHVAVVRALGLLRRQGRPARVIATGLMEDDRHPGYVDELRALIATEGVETDFDARGIVSLDELGALYRAAAAVVNPSYFEGWSTSVEEAKSLGKHVILSDIPVHREQAPPRGVYVAADDWAALAEAMAAAVDAHDPTAEAAAMTAALAELPARIRAFGTTYCAIVADVITDAAARNGRRNHV